MSAKSEAYHGLQPRDLEFFHNWAHRNTFFCDPKNILPDDFGIRHFRGMPDYLLGSTGADVAATSLSCLLFWYGSYTGHPVEIQPAYPEYDQPAQPYKDVLGIGVYQDQWTWITPEEASTRRPFYKARRSYWTGAPRRRRNLPA